jgi:hypothetical protein
MRTIRLLALSTLLAATAFVKFGPPWISIEYPGNPYDAESRGNYLYVHVFHHAAPVGLPVAGTAEGLVNGARRSVKLDFTRTSRAGVYALTKQWAPEGTWTLVISATQGDGENNTANAVVEIGAAGDVTSVKVPTMRRNDYTVPAPVVMADIDAALRARAARVATR